MECFNCIFLLSHIHLNESSSEERDKGREEIEERKREREIERIGKIENEEEVKWKAENVKKK